MNHVRTRAPVVHTAARITHAVHRVSAVKLHDVLTYACPGSHTVHARHSVSEVKVQALLRYVDPFEHTAHVWHPEAAPTIGLNVPTGHATVV